MKIFQSEFKPKYKSADEFWLADIALSKTFRVQPTATRYKRCPMCPADDLYFDYCQSLSRQKPEVIKEALSKWGCHLTGGRLRCKGAHEVVGRLRDKR